MSLIGQTINHLYIESLEGQYFTCKCLNCGKYPYKRRKDSFVQKIPAYSCGCISRRRKREQLHNWTGFKDITGHQFSRWRTNAKKRNIQFDISVKDIWELYECQNKICPITKEHLFFYENPETGYTNASLDRIDNTKGYLKSNLLITTIDFNKFHHIYSLKEILKWSKLICEQYITEENFTMPKMYYWIYGQCLSGFRLRNKISIFDITKYDMLNQFNFQKGRCFYTNVPIKVCPYAKNQKKDCTASLDRLDSNLGYTKDNIVWCHKIINMMKKDFSIDRFKELAEMSVKNLPAIIKNYCD